MRSPFETKSLEAEFRRELEGPRTTCAEDARGALRRAKKRYLVSGSPFVRKEEVAYPGQVGNVEEVENLTDQVELDCFGKAERLRYAQILRDDRIATQRLIIR